LIEDNNLQLNDQQTNIIHLQKQLELKQTELLSIQKIISSTDVKATLKELNKEHTMRLMQINKEMNK